MHLGLENVVLLVESHQSVIDIFRAILKAAVALHLIRKKGVSHVS